MINRRGFIASATIALIAAPMAATAQQSGKVRRIGYLGIAPSYTDEVFSRTLRDLGWTEGRNLAIEYRWSEGRSERIAEIAAEFARSKVDVIYAPGSAVAAAAAKRATRTIPIVFAGPADPVALGLVSSLSRPGGNLTGIGGDVETGKRLELLREAVPRLGRVAVLWNPSNPSQPIALASARAAASSLGIELRELRVGSAADLEAAFATIANEKAGALLISGDALFFRHRARIVALAAAQRLPAIYNSPPYVEAGGLMSYGASRRGRARRAAALVDKILRGTKPADIPVEQPTTFELVINMKTAKALGIDVPQSILIRADEVIE